MTMNFTRRLFLGAGLAGLGALALPRRARAAGPHNLVVVFARGGWDPVWAIDPKSSSDIDSPAGTVKKFHNNQIDILTDATRPNVEAFFAAYADQCAVVRGISVGSIAHFSCHVRMMTGTRTELSPDLGMVTAVTHGGELPLPYADIGGGAYAGAHAAKMGRLGQRNQVVTLINRAKAHKPAASLDYDDPTLLDITPAELADLRAYAEARADKAAPVRAAFGENARRLGDYRDCFQRADDLRAIPELQGLQLSGNSSLASQLDLAITMLQQTSCAVYLDSRQDWDTHDNIADQGDNHNAMFADLALLMQKLADAELTGNTTVVVMSEMGRTPKLNAPGPTGGKDHWPVTSALVLGAGVAPGVYGGTDNQLNARNIDLTTGKADDNSPDTLGYDNFAAGLLTLVGVADTEEWIPDAKPMLGFLA
jgi:uncharacterized protein (DUF1501 family)